MWCHQNVISTSRLWNHLAKIVTRRQNDDSVFCFGLRERNLAQTLRYFWSQLNAVLSKTLTAAQLSFTKKDFLRHSIPVFWPLPDKSGHELIHYCAVSAFGTRPHRILWVLRHWNNFLLPSSGIMTSVGILTAVTRLSLQAVWEQSGSEEIRHDVTNKNVLVAG